MKEWIDRSAFARSIHTVHEDPILGTGGTLLQNREFVGNKPLMLIHADNLCLADIPAFIKAHEYRPPGTEITMMTFTAQAPEACGIVEIDDKGIVQGFYEKVPNPPGNLANAAVYILEPSVIKFLEGWNSKFIDFSTQVLPHYIGKINTYYNKVYHRDIGTVESLLAAQIEYPVQDEKISAIDSWENICLKNNSGIVSHIKKGLSTALNAEMTGVPKFLKSSHLINESLIMITIEDIGEFDRNIKELKKRIETYKCRILIFFTKVKPGFSSKVFYEQYGLNSFAMCVSQGDV